ncbi:DNA recombination protein RmuC [Nevskia soli]|uniref:DNA recombination protein RmuC n=1 Tax=Nevskia soli TaxID=418856 RepID=UPI00068A1CFB|nr:DNA recombination protein RmuC [Nevskia soli]
MTPSTLLIVVLAAALGALLAWLAGRAPTERQRANAAAAEASAAAQAQAAAAREQELSGARAVGEQLRAQLAAAQSEGAVLRITLDKEREAAADKLKLLQQTGEEMTLRFKQLSQEILEDKSRRFTEQNQLNIEQILKPLREKIAGFEQQVKQSYELETRDRVALKEQIAQLARLNQQVSAEANNLAGALRGQARTQGAWGELILERILELSGLEKGREYETQFATRDEAGQRYRPDVVVHLPGGRDIIIDAKASLSAYARFSEAVDEAARETALAAHVTSLRGHIRELGGKNYQSLEGIGSLDFVLMFVPNEAAYIDAVRSAPGLYEEALTQNIGLVCPSTLLPTLRTVNNLWKVERQGRNAQQIAEEAGRLYDKFVGFEQDLSRLGSALNSASKAYADARGKLLEGPGNVVRKIELLKKMGAKASKQLPDALRSQALPDLDEEIEEGGGES